MEIKYYTRSVYGTLTVYPGCDTARKLCALAGKKTFTNATIAQVKALGYVFVSIPDPDGFASIDQL